MHSKNTCPEEKPSSKHRPLAHGPPFSRYIFLKAPSFFLPLTSSILKGKSVFHEVKAPQCTVHHTRARLTTISLEIRATAKQNTQTHAEVRESSQGRVRARSSQTSGPTCHPPGPRSTRPPSSTGCPCAARGFTFAHGRIQCPAVRSRGAPPLTAAASGCHGTLARELQQQRPRDKSISASLAR